jgi:hypothetical protein
MKTITEIIGGAQGLPDIPFDSRDVFEEYLTDEYKNISAYAPCSGRSAAARCQRLCRDRKNPLSAPDVCNMRMG